MKRHVMVRVAVSIAAVMAVLGWPAAAAAQIVLGPAGGGNPQVFVIDGAVTQTIQAYDPLFPGGVNATLGDVNGDGTLDIITGAGPTGGPHVRVLSGTDLSELASFYAYDPAFKGGVNVAAGDLDGDGRAEVITGAGPGGGPHVRAFSIVPTLVEVASFYAYDPAFKGGVSVAAGDVNGDGVSEIITAAGPSGGPHIRVITGTTTPTELASFYAYDPAFMGGVRVAAGDINGDGLSDIVTSAGPTGGPHVRVITGTTTPTELFSFYAFDPAFTGGVYVATGDINADGRVDLIVGAGPGGSPLVRVLSGTDLSELASFVAPTTGGGVTVGSRGDAGVRFTSATSTTFVSGSAGTFAVTTAGFQASLVPTLTVSGALPTGVTFTDNGDGTATLAGTPAAGTFGNYPLTFTATNGLGAPRTQSFTLRVTEATSITSANATNFAIALAGSFTVTTTGAPVPTITASGTLPTGVTFVDNGNGTATLAGTPGVGTDGTYPLTLTASNGVGAPAVQAFTLTVGTPQAPAITSASATPFTVGAAGSFTVTTTGAPAPTLTIGGASLPFGVNFVDNGNGTGTLSGTPPAGSSGIYAITFTAANGIGAPAVQSFTLTVNQGPAITSANAVSFAVAVPGTFTVTTTGFPAPAITQGGVALPTGVTFADNGDGTGTLSGMPAAGTAGAYAITFTASNGVGVPVTQAFTLTVQQAPGITSANTTTFVVGTPGSFTVTTTGFPPPSLTLGGVSLPAGVTFVDNGNGTGTLSGTPAAGTAGTYAITFTASNSAGVPVVQPFTLIVGDVPAIDLDLDDSGGTLGNDFAITYAESSPPQFIEDVVDATITDVDSPTLTSITVTITNVLDNLQEKLDVDLVTGGFNANVTKAFDETTTPGVAVLTITATTPQPLADFNTLLRRVTYQNIDTGADTTAPRTITFVVNDGVGNSNTATTTVTITAADDPPTADNDSYTVAEGGTLNIAAPGVLDGDIDPEGDPLTAVLVTGPANATTFTLNSDGSFTYTHNGSETTTDSFTYRAVANGLQSAPATVTITITAVNDAPAITAGGTLNFIEGNPATAIDGTILVTDADSTNLASATVVIAGNYVNGQDVLVLPVTAGITGLFTPATATLTLTGSATVAAYQAALRTVTYFNNSGTPSVAPRTVTWVVNDGTLSSNIAASTITVTAVNSSPIGVADAWTTFGNTDLVVDQAGPATPFVADTTTSTFGVLDNDTDPENDPRSVAGIVGCADTTAPYVCTTTAGGSVTMESNGRFTYRPQAGDTGADSFQYILTDTPSSGVAGTANVTVNLTLQERIWYVNGNVAGPGTGTSSDPFSALPATAGDADDYVFVHNSTVTGGITLQNGQKLYGEAFGLSINQALNGNPAPVVLVAPGTSPTINATTGNAVGVLANTASGNLTNIEIRGLTLATTAASANAIDITTANAANVAVTISGVIVTGATAEGIDINQGSTGTATVAMTNVNVTSTGNGIDLNESAGTLTVTSFNGITITGDTGGSGIVVTNATFDATAGGAYNQVAGGATAVGDASNPVGGAGVVLANVSGDLAFTDLDIFTTNGTGLLVSGTGAVNVGAGTGTRVTVASGVGTLQSVGGPVLDITNATVDLPLDSASVTSSPTTGISLVNVASGTTAASVSATSGSITSTTGISANVSGGTVSLNYGGNITQTNNVAMVSVSGGHTTGTITFSGTLNATNGPGLVFDNADSTTSYNFTGTTTLNGGDAGIDIVNASAGTFTFGTGTTITNPSGTAFLLSGSNANVTYSGSITDNTGFAVDISGHAAGTVTFQTGSITSTGNGLQVSNNTGGAVNFNNPTIALTTGANKAVTLDVGNAGGTITFAPAGGNGLDISTTTGTGFSALGGGTISVSGAGNTINSTGAMAIELLGVTVGAGGVNFATTTSGGGVRNVKLTSVTGGTIALGGGTLTGATGAAFLVGDGAGGASTGGTSAITYGGSITSTGTARAVDIQDRAAGAGNITLSGTITHSSGNANVIFLDDNAAGTITFSGTNSVANGGTSTAVSLTDNTGATISFTGGGLNIDATGAAGSGFVATGGGTVSVTGTGNTIDTTTSAALNVTSTTIGASGMTWQSINSNGATKGITLNTTGSGAFTVAGTGSAGTGGTIQNATNRGAEFISVSSVTLNNLTLNNNGIGASNVNCGNALGATVTGSFVTDTSCISNLHLQTVTTAVLSGVTINNSDGHGINGYQVSNLTLSNVSVELNGNEVGEDGVQLVNSGNVTVSGTNTFRDSASNQFEAQNGSGTSVFTIAGSLFGLTNFPTTGAAEAPSPGSSTANSGLLISGSGTANMTVTVTGSTFDENYANGYLSDTAGSATMNITLGTAGSGNTFTNNGVPIEIVNAATGSMTYAIRNNTVTNNTTVTGIFATTALTASRSGTGSLMTGTIDGNTIGSSAAGATNSGCFVSLCNGMELTDSATSSTNVYHVTVTNNQIYHVQGGITSNIAGIAGSPRTSFVITGNTIGNPDLSGSSNNNNGILINSGVLQNATVSPQTCVEISGNTLNGNWGAGFNDDSIRYRHRGQGAGTSFQVRNFTTGGDIDAFVTGINTAGAGTVDLFGFQLVGTNAFTGSAAACPQ